MEMDSLLPAASLPRQEQSSWLPTPLPACSAAQEFPKSIAFNTCSNKESSSLRNFVS